MILLIVLKPEILRSFTKCMWTQFIESRLQNIWYVFLLTKNVLPYIQTANNHVPKPPNEWKLEQGFEAAKLSLRNQSGIPITIESKHLPTSNEAELRPGDHPDDSGIVFTEEREGWKGYVEWEKYPEKKTQAATRFSKYKFPPPPEFQLGNLPDTNPVLQGTRWKLWHKAIGGPLADYPEESWRRVLKVRLHKSVMPCSNLNMFCTGKT